MAQENQYTPDIIKGEQMVNQKERSILITVLCLYLITELSIKYIYAELPIAKIVFCVLVLLSGLSIIKSGDLQFNPYVIGYSLFLLYSFVQTIFIRNERAVETLFEMAICVVLILLVSNIICSQEQLNYLFYSFAVSGGIFSAFVFSSYNYSFVKIMAATDSGLRIGSELTNPNFIGIICSYCGCVGLFLLIDNLEKRNYLHSFLLGIGSIFSLVFALLSGSRKTYMTIFLGCLILFFSSIRQKLTLKRALFMLIGAGIGVALFLNLEVFSWSRHRLLQMFLLVFGEGTAEGSINHRELLIKESLELFRRRPFFGNGLEAVRQLTGSYAHNNFAELLASSGISGFFLYYSSYFVTLILLINYKGKKDILYYIALFTLLSISINEIAQVTYYDRFVQVRLALIASYLIIENYNQKEFPYVQKNSNQKY